MTSVETLLTRSVAEIIEEKSLKIKLKSGKPLRVKFGIDPTGPDIHLGHTIPLLKLREFQDLGHKAILIIGDYTATVGDPSGKDTTRNALTYAEVKRNAAGYLGQAYRILDKKNTEVRYNSEWFKKLGVLGFLELQAKTTVPQLLSHETFRKRMDSSENTLSTHELMYPILQGYDSVMVRADVELGGIDQKFNLLMGRQLQEIYGQPKQDIVMMKYLTGTDGKTKMGKSTGNYIAVNDTPADMYGKVMSIPDSIIEEYFELLTDLIYHPKKGVEARTQKARLANFIVTKFHGSENASRSAEHFETLYKDKKFDENAAQEVKVKSGNVSVTDLLNNLGSVTSKSEARRLIEGGGVTLDGEKLMDINFQIKLVKNLSHNLKVGKHKLYRIVVN